MRVRCRLSRFSRSIRVSGRVVGVVFRCVRWVDELSVGWVLVGVVLVRLRLRLIVGVLVCVLCSRVSGRVSLILLVRLSALSGGATRRCWRLLLGILMWVRVCRRIVRLGLVLRLRMFLLLFRI